MDFEARLAIEDLDGTADISIKEERVIKIDGNKSKEGEMVAKMDEWPPERLAGKEDRPDA